MRIISKLRHFPAPILLLETIIGSILSISSFLLFLKLRGETFEKDLAFFDDSLTSFFYGLRNPALTKIMILISYAGGEIVVVLAIVIVIYLFIRHHRREAFLVLFLFVVSAILDNLLKIAIARPRPVLSPLLIERDYSFPSGHAMNSFVFYIGLTYLFYQISRNKKLSIAVFLIATVIVFLIGISRIYLGVHYPTDVIGGYIAGFCWFSSVVVIEKTFLVLKIIRHKA